MAVFFDLLICRLTRRSTLAYIDVRVKASAVLGLVLSLLLFGLLPLTAGCGSAPTGVPSPAPIPNSTISMATSLPSPTLVTLTPSPTLTLTPRPTEALSTASPVPTQEPLLPSDPGDGKLPFFGVVMEHITEPYGLEQAQESGVGLVHHKLIPWKEVEPERTEPPTYRWEVLEELEAELRNAADAGLGVTILVIFTPDWAQGLPGHSCGPIEEDRLDEFAQFLQAAVERYGVPPYNVKHWELFNEPDIDPSLVAPNSGYGCWGDLEDDHYGGQTYARMLKAAYPAIKEVDPEAQVIFGGLLLDAPDSAPTLFLTGVLEEGGGEFFDILAFHAYTFYSPDVYQWSTVPGTKWIDWGGVVVGKTTYLRQVLDSYGYDKPLVLNEAGLGWVSSSKPSPAYRQAQADYVTKLYARGRALGLAGIAWFGWRGPGWRQMALLNKDLSPRPAYHAFVFAIQQLSNVEYLGPVDHPGIEGYRFRREGDELLVLWSVDGDDHTVTVSAARFMGAVDREGQVVPYKKTADEIAFDVRRPVYFELKLSPGN